MNYLVEYKFIVGGGAIASDFVDTIHEITARVEEVLQDYTTKGLILKEIRVAE